jgi:hypothetical protein
MLIVHFMFRPFTRHQVQPSTVGCTGSPVTLARVYRGIFYVDSLIYWGVMLPETASVVRGQNSWLEAQRSLIRFPALPEFLRSSRSGTGSTQPCEYN